MRTSSAKLFPFTCVPLRLGSVFIKSHDKLIDKGDGDCIPIRTILNKYGVFVAEVHKVAKKRVLTERDSALVRRAKLIAALSSSHSWQTYRYLRYGGDLDRTKILEEASYAFNEGWRNVSETDVEEVVSTRVPEHALSMWVFCALPKDERPEFKELFGMIKEEFKDGLEPIERIQE